MREYVVREGDTPARIAARDDMAGCPKCARDLVAANAHKEAVVHPNGFVSFRELRVGEKLNLPDKWFDGSLDKLPKSYFAALPHPDGVTPSGLGLGDLNQFSAASATATALSKMDDRTFSNAVDGACTLVDQAVHEADSSPNKGVAAYAQAVHTATNAARQRNQDLVAAITAGDQATAAKARADVQTDISTALDAAQLALQAVYGSGGTTPPPPPIPQDTITAVARAAVAALDCASISHPGSAANAAMHAFKASWNAANPNSPVPINTGTYEQATADVLTRVLGSAPPACPAHTPSVPGGGGGGGDIVPPQASQGLSVGAIVGLGLLGVGAVGGAIYLATRDTKPRRKPRVRRVRPEPNPMIRPRGPRYDTVAPWKKDFS